MSPIKLGMLACSLFAVTAVALAAEPDELRERARTMEREAAELAERGHEVETKNQKRHSLDMLEEAEHRMHQRPENRNAEIRERKERLKQLLLEERELATTGGKEERLADVRNETEKIARELYELTRDVHHEEAGPPQEAARRLEHMRAAIEHLHHAGLNDIAEHVKERSEATERELHERQRHHDGDPIHEIMKQLDQMRNELGRLRDEVNDLKRRRD